MFNQTWKKYLPVITILIKRSSTGDQTLVLNHTDFDRASGGRKMKWSFPVMQLRSGRIQNNGTKYPLLATDLVTELQIDEQIIKLLDKKEFELSMTNDLKLLIRNITDVPEKTIEDSNGEGGITETEESKVL